MHDASNEGNRGRRRDRIGDSETFIFICTYAGKCTHPHGPHKLTPKFCNKEGDKIPSVISLDEMVNVLDCENVTVSTKLGNKDNQNCQHWPI